MSRFFRGKNGIFRNPLSNTTDAAPSVLRYPCATPPLLRGADRRARKSRKPLDRLAADNYNAVIGLAFANLHVWGRFPAGPAMRGGVKAVQLLRSGENYLKTILILQKQNAAVRSIEQQRPRSVHLLPRAMQRETLRRRTSSCRRSGCHSLYLSPTGGPMCPDSMLHMLHRVLKRAGLEKIRFHVRKTGKLPVFVKAWVRRDSKTAKRPEI